MLPIIDPTETVPIQFDFSGLLASYPGATITGIRVMVELTKGTDADPSARLIGAPSESNLVVTQFFGAENKPGETRYRIACNVDVSGTSYKPTIALALTVKKRVDG